MKPKLVSNDNILWLRALWLLMLARYHKSQAEAMVEQPQDPLQWIQVPEERREEFPSFLARPETQVVVEALQLTRVHFNQGALGLWDTKLPNLQLL